MITLEIKFSPSLGYVIIAACLFSDLWMNSLMAVLCHVWSLKSVCSISLVDGHILNCFKQMNYLVFAEGCYLLEYTLHSSKQFTTQL